jgi:hypothetical protein
LALGLRGVLMVRCMVLVSCSLGADEFGANFTVDEAPGVTLGELGLVTARRLWSYGDDTTAVEVRYIKHKDQYDSSSLRKPRTAATNFGQAASCSVNR